MRSDRLHRILRWGILALILIAIAIQFIPVNRTNPPVESEAPFPEDVLSILRGSCYDCHSHETVWPWYSRIAPVSFLIANDVNEGREHLNLSTWNRLSAADRIDAIEEIWEQVEDGDMPLWYYLPAHPEARLSDDERAVLKAWAQEAEQEERQ
jgi:hypothetical protein